MPSILTRIRQSQRDTAEARIRCFQVLYRGEISTLNKSEAIDFIARRCRKCNKREHDNAAMEFARKLVKATADHHTGYQAMTYSGTASSAAFSVRYNLAGEFE